MVSVFVSWNTRTRKQMNQKHEKTQRQNKQKYCFSLSAKTVNDFAQVIGFSSRSRVVEFLMQDFINKNKKEEASPSKQTPEQTLERNVSL